MSLQIKEKKNVLLLYKKKNGFKYCLSKKQSFRESDPHKVQFICCTCTLTVPTSNNKIKLEISFAFKDRTFLYVE